MTNIIAPPPIREPISSTDSGLISAVWTRWFAKFYSDLKKQSGNVNGPVQVLKGEVAVFDDASGTNITGGGILGSMAFQSSADFVKAGGLADVAFTGQYQDLLGQPGIFNTIAIAGQTDVVAVGSGDTLTIVDSSNIATTTDAVLKTLTPDLTITGVSAGSYGAADTVGTFTVDAKGRLTAAANSKIAIIASQVSDFNEAVDDEVATLIQNGTGIAWTYDDSKNTLTGNVSITQYTDEMAEDAVGGILTDTATIDFTYNDAGNQITADLKNTTVVAGSYTNTSLTVDAQGRLTAASSGAGGSSSGDFSSSFLLMGA